VVLVALLQAELTALLSKSPFFKITGGIKDIGLAQVPFC
jgi:hypothetical protein